MDCARPFGGLNKIFVVFWSFRGGYQNAMGCARLWRGINNVITFRVFHSLRIIRGVVLIRDLLFLGHFEVVTTIPWVTLIRGVVYT